VVDTGVEGLAVVGGEVGVAGLDDGGTGFGADGGVCEDVGEDLGAELGGEAE
jgi:hypothetical protein